MWEYERLVRMRDTDATGALFFGAAFEIAVEAFEEWLYVRGIRLEKETFALPIVHAEATYLAPVKLGDLLQIQLKVKKMGITSFTTEASFKQGCVTITHVAVAKGTGHKIEIPDVVKDLSSEM